MIKTHKQVVINNVVQRVEQPLNYDKTFEDTDVDSVTDYPQENVEVAAAQYGHNGLKEPNRPDVVPTPEMTDNNNYGYNNNYGQPSGGYSRGNQSPAFHKAIKETKRSKGHRLK